VNRFTIHHIDGRLATAPNVFNSRIAAEAEAEARILASETTGTPFGNGEFFVRDQHGNEHGCTETPDSFHVWIRPATATLTRIKNAVQFIGVTDVRVRAIHYYWGGPTDPAHGRVELYIDGRWVTSRYFEEFVEIVHAQAAPVSVSFAPLRVVDVVPEAARSSALSGRRKMTAREQEAFANIM
jgi:hypothetical protein